MSEVVFYRFQPDAMDKEMLERLFIGRNRRNLLKELTKEIESAVKNQTPRYYLIIGPRGVGKTHFISLLYYDVIERIENVLPIKLSEEEYSIYRVSDLLLRMLGMMGERERNDFGEFERMSDDEVVVAALEELKSKGKTIVLFLENLNQILGEQMSKKEVQRLRSIFQTENIFTVVTTAPLVFPQISEHQEPFFNFFDIIYLKELTRDELMELVREIAEIENNEEFLSKMDEYAQKIDAVGILTGGSPRMAILLYELMSKGKIVDVEKAFFKLLDENTPYYQDVFRLLSSQKRKVFDTLISIGKPATPKEIAKRARLDDKTVNTQLRRLEKDGYVISRRMGKTTKYEVRERLFRLWRELRRQPFAMQKLSILVEFLELWYSVEERKEKVLEYFEHLRGDLDETIAREASYWFLSLPKEYKMELVPQVVKEFYEVGEVKLLDELVYGDKELKEEAIVTEVRILLEKEKNEEALEKAGAMIKLDEKNAIAWLIKGEVLRLLGRYEDALDALSKAIDLNPDNADAWFMKGMALGALGRYEDALAASSKAIELNPDNADAWLRKGMALEALGRYEDALAALSKAIELNPDNADAWSRKGAALGALGRYEDALAALSKAIELNPDNADAWLWKGMALGALGRYEDALAASSKAIELNPEDADAWLWKGMALGALGRYEDALAASSKAIELNPEDADAWLWKGMALEALGRYEDALAALSKAIELNPDNADAWSRKGAALGALGRYEDALAASSKAIELNPEDADAWLRKGMALEALGRYEDALAASSKAIELNPDNADAWFYKGGVLAFLGRNEEALDAFSKSIELNPDNADAWLGKGMALMDLERPEETLEALSKSIELNPVGALACRQKGGVLIYLDRHEEALEALSKAIELNPEDADAWFNKGLALGNLERPEEALEAFSKSIELHPKDADAWFNKGSAHLNISTREFESNNYGNALKNMNSAMKALDSFSKLSKDKEAAKEGIKESLMEFVKELIDAKNAESVEMALNAMFEKKEKLKELFKPISIAVEIVKSKDVSKYYELQVERREVVADIVKKLTGSEELLPEEYRSR